MLLSPTPQYEFNLISNKSFQIRTFKFQIDQLTSIFNKK
ncbi:hypothetical protein N646_4068 [Vibrio alginolyticus NBRC 15630 = ATCC 17749]|uniref:Uncharacterized protein n=1 Tax=Vibrio alginolyticus (strain ATCC 17749 / DSM 2171 / NBRC 15630 / NCIMB 1903 / NCTC 12160 / XII-53) TaxID=1219076 RepID=A0A2I3CQ00_VIBAX|nr:hypothetical protein N646_4068 [Vibrio alginolyticus NBRC 15630 = ATCC 17749]